MKLKAMYNCVSSARDSDGPYEINDSKTYQAKKLNKTSKKSAFRSKLKSLNNSLKTPSETPPKSPLKIVSPSSFTTRESMEIEKHTVMKNNNSNLEKDLTNNNVVNGIKTADSTKHTSTKTKHKRTWFQSKSNQSVKTEEQKSTQRNDTCDLEDEIVEKSSFNLNSDTFDDLSSSHDDVFTISTPTFIIGNNTWDQKIHSSSEDSDESQLKLLKAFKLKNPQQINDSSENLIPLSRDSSLEDIKSQRLTNCKLEKTTNSLSSLSSMSSANFARTSVDRATDSFETLRALCDQERLPRGHSFQQGPSPSAKVSLTPRRAFSTSPTVGKVNWNDIPPIIPPREPIRSSQLSPPQRHSSSPSSTSVSRRSPSSSSKSVTNFSSSTPLENHRPKYTTQSSTTPVFSALPPCKTKSNPVILPIMKDGKQESHTHYFLLGDEEQSEKPKRPIRSHPEPLHGIPRPVPKSRLISLGSIPPPRPPPLSTHQFKSRMSAEAERERTNSLPLPNEISTNQASTYPYRKLSTSLTTSANNLSTEKSRTEPRCTAMSPGQMINALQSQVFGVTNEECQLALRKNDWCVSKSINYLKVEQLFRTGYVSRENCHQILRKTGWDLESASQILLEHYIQKQKTRS